MCRRFQLTKLAFVVFAMATLSTSSARAATPSQISIQGRLTDADGNPVAPGVKVFQFRVFDASVGGSLWWPFSVGFEQQNISTNSEGLWTAMLGAVTPLTGEVFADTSRWLEIRVDGQLLSPRVRLGSALRVSTVDGATGGVVTGNVYLKGTTVGPAGGAYLQFNDGSGTAMGYVGDGGADQDLYFFAYIGDVNLNTSSGNITLGSNGKVGIGTTSPSTELDVRGVMYCADGMMIGSEPPSSQSALVYFDNDLEGWGWIVSADNSAGVRVFTVENNGDVFVAGNLSKGGGSFKIDHPLDPANKYLSHSFVESPDMMNIYNGVIVTDPDGSATITMPDWFETLNRDFRYQLTVIGQFAQAIISEKVVGNQFSIKTDKPSVEVSWQVTGIRQDAYANAHRIPVEEEKPSAERGTYLHPDVFAKQGSRGYQR